MNTPPVFGLPRSLQSRILQIFAESPKGSGDRPGSVSIPQFRTCALILSVFLMSLPLIVSAASGDEVTVMLPGDVPMVLVEVPAGTFLMGSPDGERGNVLENETQHEVTLTQKYYIGKTEVTQQQWFAVMGTAMPASCGSAGVGDDFPVYCVGWEDMAGPGGFMEKLNGHLGTQGFRLPTEAEWERAARAGTTTRFSHGDVLECGDECQACPAHDDFIWWCGNSPTEPGAVGLKQPNPFGLHDMHGNMWEFVQDRFGEFSADPATDPVGPANGNDRVIRGGDYVGEANYARSASRVSANPTAAIGAGPSIGFRVATSSLAGLVVEINAGFNDAWSNPVKKGGQGVFVVVFPALKLIFIGWFTYDLTQPDEGVEYTLGHSGHRWYTGVGPYEGDTAVIDVELTQGGIFDSDTEIEQGPAGTVTLKAMSCKEMLMTYEIFSAEVSGDILLKRSAEDSDNIAYCESLAAQEQ